MQGGFVYGVKLENVRIDVSDFQGNSYSEAGGIAAVINSSYLKDCSVSGEIAAVGAAGGIAGSVHWGYLENCAFSGIAPSKRGRVCPDEGLPAGFPAGRPSLLSAVNFFFRKRSKREPGKVGNRSKNIPADRAGI